MGTYTTNYNLFMPTVGEQGWGDLVNNNFSTIDATMKSLSIGIGTLETEANVFDGRITTLEGAFNFDENGDIESINGLVMAVTATTTDQGLGVIMSNSSYTLPIGFKFTNTEDTKEITATFTANPQFPNANCNGMVYGTNVLTGVKRTIASYLTYGTYTYTVNMFEYITASKTNGTVSVSQPTVYLNAR